MKIRPILKKTLLLSASLFLTTSMMGIVPYNSYRLFNYDRSTHHYTLVRHVNNYVQAHASSTDNQKSLSVSNSSAVTHLQHEIKLQKQTINSLNQPPMTKHDHQLVNQLTSQVSKETEELDSLKKNHKPVIQQAPKKEVAKKYYHKNVNGSGFNNFWFWMWIMDNNNAMYYSNYYPMYYAGGLSSNSFSNNDRSFNDMDTTANDDSNTDTENGTETAEINEANQEDNSVNSQAINNASANADTDLANTTADSAVDAGNAEDNAMDASLMSSDSAMADSDADSAEMASASADSSAMAGASADTASEASMAADSASEASTAATSSASSSAASTSADSAGSSAGASAGGDAGASAGGDAGGGASAGGAETIMAPSAWLFNLISNK